MTAIGPRVEATVAALTRTVLAAAHVLIHMGMGPEQRAVPGVVAQEAALLRQVEGRDGKPVARQRTIKTPTGFGGKMIIVALVITLHSTTRHATYDFAPRKLFPVADCHSNRRCADQCQGTRSCFLKQTY